MIHSRRQNRADTTRHKASGQEPPGHAEDFVFAPKVVGTVKGARVCVCVCAC